MLRGLPSTATLDKMGKNHKGVILLRFNWDDRGNHIFWFIEEDGEPVLVHPDGTRLYLDLKKESILPFKTNQGRAGYKRALLLMKEYGIWDATAFACTMDSTFGFKIEENAVFFATCQSAERFIYPTMKDKNQVRKSRRFVDKFYADPNLQAGWPSLILHPVCFTADKDTMELIPTELSTLGNNQDVIRCAFDWPSLGAITKEDIQTVLDRMDPDD